MPTSLLIAATVFGALGGAGALSARRHARRVAALRERLCAATEAEASPTQASPAQAMSAAAIAGLPEPVARYLRRALPDGPAPRGVELVQQGRLRTDPRSPHWMPFEATHLACVSRPGFVWDARARLAGGLFARVLDTYDHGHGGGEVRLQSVLRVGRASPDPALDSGALHRYLAEAVWYPWALLPGGRVRWTPIDAQRARATLSDGPLEVSLEFRFADSGEVAGIHAPDRWGRFDGRYAQRAWDGTFSDYQREDGVLAPRRGQVAWDDEGDLEPVWQGRITALRRLDAGRPAAALQAG
jgi:hypothetical protein